MTRRRLTVIEKPQDTIHIWQIALDPVAVTDPDFQDLLSDDEVARSEKFRFKQDRLAFIHARGVFRTLLGEYLKKDPAKISFQYEQNGKPILAPCTDNPSFYFNLSHTKGMALVAVAYGSRVGIDVEFIRPVPERATIANSHFSETERMWFSPGNDDQSFFGCWTRKEAALKTIGTGLTRPLHTFGIVPQQERPNWFRVVGDFPNSDRWHVHSFAIKPDFLAAVAVEKMPLQPIFFRW